MDIDLGDYMGASFLALNDARNHIKSQSHSFKTRSYSIPGVLVTGYAAFCMRRCTCIALHSPPRGVGMPRSFSAAAIWRSEDAPSALIVSITGARSAARCVAASALAWALATFPLADTVSIAHIRPPSFTPRALAA